MSMSCEGEVFTGPLGSEEQKPTLEPLLDRVKSLIRMEQVLFYCCGSQVCVSVYMSNTRVGLNGSERSHYQL